MKAIVTFTQYYTYEVEGEDETDCMNIAEREFDADVYSPIARSWYDDYTFEEVED